MRRSFIIPIISIAVLGSQFAISAAYESTIKESDESVSTRSLKFFQEDEFYSYKRHAEEEQPAAKPWGKVIGATVLINMATLVGIVVFIPAFSRDFKHRIAAAICWSADKDFHAHEVHEHGEEGISDQHSKILDIAIPSFAAGALLATVVFLVLPESISLLNKAIIEQEEAAEAASPDGTVHEEHAGEIEKGAVWRFGTAILGGFLLPILLGALFPRSIEHECDDGCGPSERIDLLGKCLVKGADCSACAAGDEVASLAGVENGDGEKKMESADKDGDVESNGHDHGHSHAHEHSHKHGKYPRTRK